MSQWEASSCAASPINDHSQTDSEEDFRAFMVSFLAATLGASSYLMHRKYKLGLWCGEIRKGPRVFARLFLFLSIAITCIAVYGLAETGWQGHDTIMLLETFSISCLLSGIVIYTGIKLFCKRVDFDNAIVALMAIAVVGTGLGYIPYPKVADQVSGTLAVGMLHVASLVSAAALIIYRARRFEIVRRRRGLAFLIVLGIFVWFVWTDEKVGRETLTSSQTTAQSTKLQKGDVSSTAFAIHADGGGLRAALFTAVTLSLADDFTCGEFGRHLYAASGVSGGALGIATWALMRQQYVSFPEEDEASAWDACKRELAAQAQGQNLPDTASLPPGTTLPPYSRILSPSLEGPNVPTILTGVVINVLARDHLASAVGSMLTPQPFFSKASRGQHLVESWQSAVESAIGAEKFLGGYAIKLKDLNAGLTPHPLLLFTATDADTGGRVIFSNAHHAPFNEYTDMQVGSAVLNSARFPMISPPGLVEHLGAWHRVVDGGFFDNSGADSLNDALNAANAPTRPKQPNLLSIDTWHRVMDGGFFETSGAAPLKLGVIRINGNPPDLESNLCADFYEALSANGYTQYLGEVLWGPMGSPKKERLAATLTESGQTKSLPNFGGHSAVSAFWYARGARSVEAIATLKSSESAGYKKISLPAIEEDPLQNFNKNCSVENVRAFSPEDVLAVGCIEENIKLCNWSKTLRFGPLSWYISNRSGFDTWRWARSAVWNSAIVKELNRAGFAGGSKR